MRAIEGALCTGTRGAGGGVRGQAGWGEWRGNEWDLAIRLYHLKLQAGEPGAANRVICLVSVTRIREQVPWSYVQVRWSYVQARS